MGFIQKISPFNVRYIELEGTPWERGCIHGELLKGEIKKFWRGMDLVIFRTSKRDALDGLIKRFLNKTEYLKSAQKYVPDLLEEIKGIAEGAERNFEEVFAWQCLEELLWFFQITSKLYSQNNRAQCSVMGVFGQEFGPNILAQTCDNSVLFDGFQTLMRIKDNKTDFEAFMLTYPGMLGIYGLSKNGIGLCINSLAMIMKKATKGLPIVLAARKILSQPNVDTAEKFVKEIKHPTGLAISFGDPNRIVCYEISPNMINQHIPYEGAKVIYHTNHPLVNEDIDQEEMDALMRVKSEREKEAENLKTDSMLRFRFLESQLKDTPASITVDKIKEILSSHDYTDYPICVHKGSKGVIMTNFSLIMELSNSPKIHLTGGPPCISEFKTYTF